MPAVKPRPMKTPVRTKAPAKPQVGRMKTEFRTIQLPNGQWVSPQSYYLRTGRDPATLKRPQNQKEVQGFDLRKSNELAKRLLSKTWHDANKRLDGKTPLPLPTMKQRIRGGRLAENDIEPITNQVNFAVSVFANHLNPSQQKAIQGKVKNLITSKNLSISDVLRTPNLKDSYDEAKELYTFLKEHGRIYRALTDDVTGRSYFAKGWSQDAKATTTPVHEAVHILQRTGVIKIDVPFAQAADRLYGLEQGIFKSDTRLSNISKGEFDRKPKIDKMIDDKQVGKIASYKEPNWSYVTGNKLGQWVHKNILPEYRWQYMIDRCNGIGHNQAVERVKAAARGTKSTQSKKPQKSA